MWGVWRGCGAPGGNSDKDVDKDPSAALAASVAPRRTTQSTPASHLSSLPCIWVFLDVLCGGFVSEPLD